VHPFWRSGYAPDSLYAGFRRMLAEPTRQEQLAEVRHDLEAASADPYDSHPTLGARIAAAAELPELDSDVDDRSARELLRDADVVEAVMSDRISGQHLGVQPRHVLWEDAGAVVLAPAQRHEAASVLRIITETGHRRGESPPTLDDLIELAAGPDWRTVADAIAPPADDAAPDDVDEQRRELIAAAVTKVIAAAMVDAGTATWRLSWSGPNELVRQSGQQIRVHDWVLPVIGTPTALPALRGQLRRVKVPADWVPLPVRTAPRAAVSEPDAHPSPAASAAAVARRPRRGAGR
jgi:hypothetical protein